MNPRIWKTGTPNRQGAFRVTLEDGTETTAVWQEVPKTKDRRWYHYPAGRSDSDCKTPVPLDGVVSFSTPDDAEMKGFRETQKTLKERLDEVYESYERKCSLYPLFSPPIPANRRLTPGDELELGALKEVVVVELRREGQDVVYQYRHIDGNYGRPLDRGIVYSVVHWTEVVPLAANKDTNLTSEPVLYDAFRNSMLSSILHKLTLGVNDCVDYQRGYVWTDADKQRYLQSAFEGRELGRYIFVKQEFPVLDEVLDGKQRLSCLMDFYTSQIAYKGVYYHQLSPRDRRMFDNRTVQFAELPASRMNRVALLKVFLEVNAAGVPQSEEHLEKVRGLLRLEQAREVLRNIAQDARISELYDHDPDLAYALGDAFENFEYPDFAHLTVGQVLRKMDKLAG